jgi:iron(III) transport system permease protein
MICFLVAIALFAVPALIALPAGFPVVATQLWEFFLFPPHVDYAAAFSIGLLVLTALILVLQRVLLARKSYVTVTGKTGSHRLVKLGRWRPVMLTYSLVVASLTFYLPLVALGLAALSRAWGRGPIPSNLTFQNFYYVLFQDTGSQAALFNSFTFAALAATGAVFLAICVAYLTQRRLVPFPSVLEFLATAPLAIPGIVLAISFFAAFASRPFRLYGTALLVVMAFTVRFLPIAFASASAAVRSLNPEMEDAVRILGGSRGLAIRRVVAPILSRSIIGAWLLIFIPVSQELGTALFLVAPGTRVVSILLLDFSEEGSLEHLSALGLVLIAITVAVVALGMRFLDRNFITRV